MNYLLKFEDHNGRNQWFTVYYVATDGSPNLYNMAAEIEKRLGWKFKGDITPLG